MSKKSFNVKNVENSVIVGGSVQGTVQNIHQLGDQLEGSVDIKQLIQELAKLEEEMWKEANTTERRIAVSEVGKANIAAQENKFSEMITHLKSAGQWALDVATKIGVSITTELIKQVIGLP